MAYQRNRSGKSSRRSATPARSEQHTTAEQWPVQTDERSFDARILRSALDYLQRFNAPLGDSDVSDAAKYHEWVPAVICARMASVGKPLNRYALEPPSSVGQCNDLATKLRIAISELQDRPRARHSDRTEHRGEEQWIARQLQVLQLSVHPVYRSGAWQRVEIPVLKTVEQCLAYALWVMQEDRWRVRNRVRLCPYRKRPDRPPRVTKGIVWKSNDQDSGVISPSDPSAAGHFEHDHWFLDFDLDASGSLMLGPPQRFCSPQHANAFRQREFRRRKSAARKK